MKALEAERVPAISFEDAAQAALSNAAHHKEIGDKHLAAGRTAFAAASYAKGERHLLRAQRLIAALPRD